MCSMIGLAPSEQALMYSGMLESRKRVWEGPATMRCSNKMTLLCCTLPGPACFCATTASCAELTDMVATSAAMSNASHSFKYLNT